MDNCISIQGNTGHFTPGTDKNYITFEYTETTGRIREINPKSDFHVNNYMFCVNVPLQGKKKNCKCQFGQELISVAANTYTLKQ